MRIDWIVFICTVYYRIWGHMKISRCNAITML